MSEVQQPTTTAETPVVDAAATQPTETQVGAPKTETETPAAEASKPAEVATAPETKDDIAPVEDKKDAAAAVPEKKPVEPITEGQLALKGPGLLKSIIPSKKEFWLSDEAVTPHDLSSYMRGEKPEVAHPVVAWASQTGKGLLFFNKKGDTSKKTPGHVLALYDATDLKKESPHEIAFRLHGQEHVLKAASDVERDGWYMSIEKAIELGKAQKEEIHASEGYKAELEKLNKTTVVAPSATEAAAAKNIQSKKSMDATDGAQRKNSDLESEEKKDKKSRSTSRGVLDRLRNKKEPEAKKEEPATAEESKAEENHTTEAAEGAAAAGGVAAAGAAAAAAEDEPEEKKEEPVVAPTETKTDEKVKPAKRGSIFGKMQGWTSGVKSPSKEKDAKEAELKPDVPPKDNVVAANPPVLPETATTEPTETAPAEPEVKPEVAAVAGEKKSETPSKERPGFLSGLSFGNKRNRSVSPSTPMKEAPVKAEEATAAAADVPKEAAPVEEGKTDEAVAETTALEPLKPEEPAKAETTPNKRQSVLTNLGRRASKAFKGIQAPKKENTAPVTEAKTETAEAPKAVEEPATVNGESKPAETQPQAIGDVVPEAVNVGKPQDQPATVTASA